MISPLTCLLLICLFFSVRFLNMCQPRTTFCLHSGPSVLAFYGSGTRYLLSWLGMVNAGWLNSKQSEIFLQMEFIIFQDFFYIAFLPGQSAPYNRFLVQPLLFSHKMLKLRFWNFKSVFLRMQFSLVAAIFFYSSFSHLFELIFASCTV